MFQGFGGSGRTDLVSTGLSHWPIAWWRRVRLMGMSKGFCVVSVGCGIGKGCLLGVFTSNFRVFAEMGAFVVWLPDCWG